MKKTITLVMILVIGILVLSGCSSNTESYSKLESKYINLAIEKIQAKYNVNIEKEDYSYSVGEQISNNKFEKFDEKRQPKIISVSALIKEPKDTNNVVSFSMTYDVAKDEVTSISCDKE